MSICPLCNGLELISILCPYCSVEMVDSGKVLSYLDSYNPYLDEEIFIITGDSNSNQCLHLFTCPKCGYDHRYLINCRKS